MDRVSSRTISALARKIAKQFNPQKIILFGSYAYGKPTKDSDVDMLVIMPFKGRGAKKAMEILLATDPRFPIDLLVRTPEQIKTRTELGDFFIREITQKGKVLYATANG
ncbi:MAG: nucleotidyltransferase domain-containing protein [Chloroflexi bacterium]|nr:nucleotidyltransferase domain-containing protein [Chloroflexota bacterium]